jgi:hypothetical protein
MVGHCLIYWASLTLCYTGDYGLILINALSYGWVLSCTGRYCDVLIRTVV